MDPLERDFYEERRRKWRRSAFWRGVLVTLGILVVLGIIGALLGDRPRGPHIARFHLTEVIYDDPARTQLLRDLRENEDVKALIVHVSSPGGTTVGSEVAYEGLRAIAGDKPVVAVMGEVAASGGYISAIAADHVIARGNTITGSIGVLYEYPDVTELMGKIGVEMQTLRSSELKAEPSPFRPPSPAGLAAQRVLVEDSFNWFRGLVAERRGLEGAALDRVADGRVFTGRQALDLGLIDALGGEEAARDWLESRDPVLADLDVLTWEPEREDQGFSGLLGYLPGLIGKIEAVPDLDGPRLMSILR